MFFGLGRGGSKTDNNFCQIKVDEDHRNTLIFFVKASQELFENFPFIFTTCMQGVVHNNYYVHTYMKT